jgi:hypothetical protein
MHNVRAKRARTQPLRWTAWRVFVAGAPGRIRRLGTAFVFGV